MSWQESLVKVIFQGVDRMTGPLGKMETQARDLETRLGRISKLGRASSSLGFGAMAVGGGILAGMGGILKQFTTLETVQVDLENAFRGAGGRISPAFSDLREQIRKAGQILPGTEADYARLAVTMREGGMDAETMAAGAFKAAANLKVLFHLDPADAGRQFTAMGKAFGIAGQDSEAFADQIQRLHYATGITLQEMQFSIPYASAAMKSLGIQGLDASETMLTLMGVLKQTGVEGSKMGTSVNQLLNQLVALSVRFEHLKDLRGAEMKAAFGALKQNGISLDFFDKKSGNYLGLKNMVVQLGKLGTLSPEKKLLAARLFKTQGMQAAIALSDNSVVQAMAGKMQDQESLSTRVGRQLDTLSASWDALSGTAVSALQSIGDAMKPTLKPMLDRLNEIVSKVADWIVANPKLVGGIAMAVGALGGLLFVGGGAAVIVGKIATGISSMVSLLPALVPLAPWLLITAVGAGLLAGGIYLVWKHADELAPQLEGLQSEVSGLWQEIKSAVSEIANINVGLDEMGDGLTLGKLLAEYMVDSIRSLTRELTLLAGVLRHIAVLVDLAFAPLRAQMAAFNAMQGARDKGASWWDAIKAGNSAYDVSMNRSLDTTSGKWAKAQADMGTFLTGGKTGGVYSGRTGPDLQETVKGSNVWHVKRDRSAPLVAGGININLSAATDDETILRKVKEALRQARADESRRSLRTGPDSQPLAMGAH